MIEALCERFPDAASLIRRSVVSLNQEYASPEQTIQPEDEIALIPPVSGGEETDEALFTVTEQPLSADRLIRLVSNPRAGAVLTFVGTVREWTRGPANHPPGIRSVSTDGRKENERDRRGNRRALARRPGGDGPPGRPPGNRGHQRDHRGGHPHRKDAFAAGRYAIERLKEIVPIWKKEVWEDGSEWKGPQKGPWDPRVGPASPP